MVSLFTPPGKPNRLGNIYLKAVIILASFLLLAFVLLPAEARSRLSSTLGAGAGSQRVASPPSTVEEIPNIVHYVYILKDPAAQFTFGFSHFLSIFSAHHFLHPNKIILHTNCDSDSFPLHAAKNGTSGKWNKLIFANPDFNLEINTVQVPSAASNGKPIENMEHKSDFVRVAQVYEHGGIYIDFDVHVIRDLSPLRRAGFKAVSGRQLGGQINSGTFMSVPKSKVMALWKKKMGEVYTGGWTTHSNEVITAVGERLVRESGEMLIMEREAFAPGSWNNGDTDTLFRVHNDTKNAGVNVTDVFAEKARLPDFAEELHDRWDHPDRFEKWEVDWSRTYLLHAFTPDRWSHKVPGFEHITPRYVLERESNFARAVYPVAKIMYEKGWIEEADLNSHDGR
ncbi:hypothetical protein QBC40DRAFT_276591 [Triangularia verruculosa]|uniref:Glycosyl transferase n=1 Tax=Triangularia verruculosa TaxID=2587418 RepID=A0AAN7AXA2_9PEZI|nr:hypothetical protein QBC40DRAFT_276591 [Triangularia verruculosa]